MGKPTKMASALMTAGISGGAISPVVQWATENQHSLIFSSFAALIVFTSGWIYLAYLTWSWLRPTKFNTRTKEGISGKRLDRQGGQGDQKAS